FRIGSTSYVYEADLLTNVKRLAEQHLAGDIELVLFELERGPSNLPDAGTVKAMAGIAAATGVTFTVHLPLDLRHDLDAGSLHPSLRMAGRVIQITRPLAPFAYVFHLDRTDIDRPGWRDQALRAVETALRWVASPELLALENLENYDPAHLEPIYAALPISRALDIGHLWKQGKWFNNLKDYGGLDRLRVVHLHGCTEGPDGQREDHLSLARMAPERLDATIRALAGFRGALTLEVFGEADFFSSREALLESYNRVTSCPA
ncbi:MAG: cobamide remodeling phosphodiesterase CbiR, partial [Aggregatilineales bacterium]